MNSITITSFNFNEDLINEFIEFSWDIYDSDPNWIPLQREKIRRQLSSGHPFFKHGESLNFIAHDASGKCVGRINANINHNLTSQPEKIGHVGFFECIDDYETAQLLLDSACNYLRTRGVEKVWGPINYATLYSYRFLTEGFDKPCFYTDIYNPPYYPKFFEQYGFKKLKDYYSDIGTEASKLAQRYRGLSARCERSGIVIRDIDLDNFEQELKNIYPMMFEIFANNFAFSHMEYDEFYEIYSGYKDLIKPSYWRIAEDRDGELIGFLLSFPDFAQNYPNTYIGKMLGVKGRYEGTGISTALIFNALEQFLAEGYEYGILPLRIEGNTSLRYGQGLYSHLKQYSLYEFFL